MDQADLALSKGSVANFNQDAFEAWAKRQLISIEERYRAILKAGETECPVTPKVSPKRGRTKKSKSRNLLERLQAFEAETLRFMHEPDLPFTNNR